MRRNAPVAIAFYAADVHLGIMLRGITDYARQHGGWTFTVDPESTVISLASWKGWSGDGVIALINSPAEARAAREMKIPVVNFSGVLRDAGVPRVMVDHEAIGRLAAEHLLDCGFRRFAFYGAQRVWYSLQRKRGFLELVSRAGGECSILEAPSNVNTRRAWHRWQKPLEQWLGTLETPVGIMAATDPRGTVVVEACSRLGLRVPDDVAVIGVDNNDVICDFCQAPLSSVSRSAGKVGYAAAALLDRLMAGEPAPKRDILIPPDGVVKRRSTDVVAIEDPHVAAAVRYIREHVAEDFGMESLLPVVSLSRRWLTHRFKQTLGLTPHEFICRARVERAKQLLTGPEKLQLGRIADACGFHDLRRFRIVFQRFTGSTPAEYRRSNQVHG